MKVCSTCQNMYVMKFQPDGKLFWQCLSCGIMEEQEGGCLLVETLVQERSSEGYRILLNEFTRQDPTLPHIKNVKCPIEIRAPLFMAEGVGMDDQTEHDNLDEDDGSNEVESLQ